MSDVDITELEDEPGKVYVFAVSPDASKAMIEWYFSDETDGGGFQSRWKEEFDHAEALVVSGDIRRVKPEDDTVVINDE